MHNTIFSLHNIQALIFDLDGTILDNMQYHYEAWREILLENYHVFLTREEFHTHVAGTNNEYIYHILLKDALTSDQVSLMLQQKEIIYRRISTPYIKEIDGFKSFISFVKEKSNGNIKLSIATSTVKRNWQIVLKQLQIENYFDFIFDINTVKSPKPNPEIYIHTAKALEVIPSACMVFEDTPTGIAAAKAAGMSVTAILSSFSREELVGADHFIIDYENIKVLI